MSKIKNSEKKNFGKTDRCACGSSPGALDINVPLICILGGPGSGKGTQCDKILAKYNLVHLSSGDLIRNEVTQSNTPRAKSLAELIKEGQLVPNDVIIDLLRSAVKKNLSKANGFLLDGFPREKEQGIAFEAMVAPIAAILYFEAKSQVLLQRLMYRSLTSGRTDDNEVTMHNRLMVFDAHNSEILEHYKEKVIRINAERDADEIFVDVQKHLDQLLSQKNRWKSRNP